MLGISGANQSTPVCDPCYDPLHALERSGLLELLLNLLSLVFGRGISVQAKQSTEIKLRRLEQLDFADVDL